MKIQKLNIMIGNTTCNASCPFCISKMTPHNGVGIFQNENNNINWINFEKACQIANINNVDTVLLTGKGETLLFPAEITLVLKRLAKYNFPIIELQTNALVMGRDFEKCKNRLKQWRELGLNTFVISIVHYDDARNKEIYAPNGEYFILTELIQKLHNIGFSVRLNCVMLNKYMDSVDEVKGLIKFCHQNKVEQLTLKPVEIYRENTEKAKKNIIFQNTQKMLISKEKIRRVLLFLEKNAVRLRTLEFGGRVYDYNGQNVCLTDCLAHNPDSEDLRQLIFFKDGHLRYDWRYEGAILL